MSPATMRKPSRSARAMDWAARHLTPRGRASVREGTEKMLQGGFNAAKEDRDAREARMVQENQTREEMLNELRIKQLEKFISRLKPEEQKAVTAFFQKFMQHIEQYKRVGASEHQLENYAATQLELFCEHLWKDSPYNKQRIRIMMRFLRANELLPQEHVVNR